MANRVMNPPLDTRWMGHPAILLDRVDSTNRWLKSEWQQGRAKAGMVVWAEEQTAGRGRLGRHWSSPPGRHIYASCLWEPARTRMGGVLSLVAGVALVAAVRRVTGLDARLKWPNDGVIHGKKFAGILVEGGMEPTPFAVVGMGINVLGSVGPDYPHATTLSEALQGAVGREELFAQLMRELEHAYESWDRDGGQWATEQWTAYNATLGYEVRVNQPGMASWVGMAEKIDPDGGLWVAAPGRREKVMAGEVSVRLADGRYAPESF